MREQFEGEVDDTTVHDRGGNVVADLELPDAEDRLAAAELARVLRRRVAAVRAERGWSPEAMAAHLGAGTSD